MEEEEPYTSYSHKKGDREISRKNTPSFGGEKGDKLTKLLPKSIHDIHEYFKKIRREMSKESPKEFESKEKSRLIYEECEHAATPYGPQRSHMPRIAIREMERGEEVAMRKNLSDFLKYYESQTQKCQDHLSFSEFCKIKVKGREQLDRFVLYTFDVSPTYSAKD